MGAFDFDFEDECGGGVFEEAEIGGEESFVEEGGEEVRSSLSPIFFNAASAYGCLADHLPY